MRALYLFAALTAALGVPAVAAACPVCFDADGARRIAYYVTTAGMLVLPLAMGAGMLFWLRRRLSAGGRGAARGPSGAGPLG